MSGPDGSIAKALLKAEVDELVCVTQFDAYLRTITGEIFAGEAIAHPVRIEIDVPGIRSQLLKAYPLIDRWASRRQSVSTTLEHMLEYTASLIQIVGNYPPQFAVLETGAPHHLFSYCLDVALRFLGVPIYYLYGNAFDGRCLVVEGNEKRNFIPVSEYSAQAVIDDYIEQVRRNASYIPADSTRSLAPFLHKWIGYAFFLHLRHHAATWYGKVIRRRVGVCTGAPVKLDFPFIGLREAIGILRTHRQYRRFLTEAGPFDTKRIGANDIVYVGHMVPEATSFPESPDYPGEVDVLLDLKNRFPSASVFYREHPAISIYAEFGHVHFQGLHKCPAFYHQLKRLGIEIVPPSIHIAKIRERDCLFATKTGRVAVENSILGIATLVYGFPFYGRDLPYTLSVAGLVSRLSVQDIKTKVRPIGDSTCAVRNYLVAIFSGSIENPGIGLGEDESARPSFEAGLLQLVGQLEAMGRSGKSLKGFPP